MSSEASGGLVDLFGRSQSYESEDVREETGMLRVGDDRLLYVAALPRNSSAGTGLILCHSYFEMSALQAAELELVRATASSGYPAIYVEAPGVGDSEGDGLKCTVEARVAAALAAWEALQKRAPGTTRPCFVGVRAGAIVALRCASKVEQGAAVLLWDPALDADTYWRQIRRLSRVSAVAGARSRFREPQEEMLAEGRVTVTGLTFTNELLDDLRDATDGTHPVNGPVFVVLPRYGDEKSVRSRLIVDRERVTFAQLSQRDFWHVGMRSGQGAIEPSIEWMRKTLQ